MSLYLDRRLTNRSGSGSRTKNPGRASEQVFSFHNPSCSNHFLYIAYGNAIQYSIPDAADRFND